VDPTGQSIQGPALSTLTSAFHNVISQRLAHTEPLAPVQLASLELAPGMLFQERAPVVWGEVFGSQRSRGNDGLALAYDHDYIGFTGGYERDFHNARVGLFAGFAQADAETEITSIQTDTDSFFGGGYAHFYLGPVNLTASLAAGVEDHENDRTVIDNLAGIETARSDFSSVFFSPSITLSSAYTLNEVFELRPSASLTYYVAWYDSYNESGTTRSNLSIDDRTDQALIGRVQLALAMALTDTTELELRTGVISRHTDQDNVNASLAGASFQYAAAGDDSVYGGLVGGNVRVHVTDRLDVMGDAEIIHASGDESDISARLRIEYRF
jgi:outer membrane autotransporter protein